MTLTVIGVLLTASQVFFWSPIGRTLLTNEYLYLVLAIFLPIVFITQPVSGKSTGRLPWYDIVLAGLAMALNLYFAINAQNVINFGWDYAAPNVAIVIAYAHWLLTLEALRRAAGLIVTILAGAFSLFPLITAEVPVSFLQGMDFDLNGTAIMHVMGSESILGLPLQTAAGILIGFLLFGVVLQRTGGAEFFNDFAQSIFGTQRGGAAKVSVVSTTAFGMMSGSAVSNVLTTGPMTIPAMKRSGFSPKYAASVEATASSGGSVTPPIMGAAAFLMVAFVGVPYVEIAIAAIIPAVLYYVGIFVQVDAYSAKSNLKGLPRADLPKLWSVIKLGWPYIAALVGLMAILIVYQREAQAPFILVAVILAYAMLRRRNRVTPTDLFGILYIAGKTIAEIIGIIAGVGLIIGSLSMTGVSLSLSSELVNLVGGNLLLMLIAGAVVSFVLGLGMTVSAVYVLLAIVLAPALVALGIEPIAAHLFVIYWATVSYITPPVALASFAAAGIAGSKPIPTSLTSMRLGMVKYIIPFAFALNPALVGQGDLGTILLSFGLSLIGVFMMACGFEGYAVGIEKRLPVLMRIIAVVAGFMIMLPETTTSIGGLAVAVVLGVLLAFRPREEKKAPIETSAEATTTLQKT
ncbi:TRAP transporter permease [Enteractinococcus fodinae]|uniref:TRAP transporter 4TM/12TM fusion protein n=1 Tax=Enteractinococcus fodinae TaxID=684663 RepID=A0ABU2AXU3_9MICC|nr:TRAP transporter fused permease subunit [Enteractinococcus fodinae]MDR7346177.1 TRAP transporter 4TM/12TM fusion protein [Enteractinococcus fodinae]